MKRRSVYISVAVTTLAIALLMYVLNGPRRNRRSIFRQSEAKIALAAIYGAEKHFFDAHSKYSTSFEAMGYSPEGLKRLFSLAVVLCENSTKTQPLVIDLPKTQKIQASLSNVKLALMRWIESEDCKKRVQGFAAYAVIESEEKPDVAEIWRINEEKVLDTFEAPFR